MELLELGLPIVLSVGDTNSCGAHIEVAMLVVASLRLNGVEMEFDVN